MTFNFFQIFKLIKLLKTSRSTSSGLLTTTLSCESSCLSGTFLFTTVSCCSTDSCNRFTGAVTTTTTVKPNTNDSSFLMSSPFILSFLLIPFFLIKNI